MIYSPSDDSYLLLDQIKKFASGRVLEIGTGSGILANAAFEITSNVTACDVNPEAISVCKKKYSGIKFVVSDLFSNIKGKYDTIIFNPPYLPLDEREDKESALATTGGKKGYEVLEKFFSKVGGFLNKDGVVLIVFSSLTKKINVDRIIVDYGFEFTELSSKKLFFEELYVYKVEKNYALKNYPTVKGLVRLTRGHRGLIYVGTYFGKKVVIKIGIPSSTAIGNIGREGEWLKKLNKYGIGPRLIKYDSDSLLYEFIDGVFIPDFFEEGSYSRIKKVIIDVFKQCFTLDKLGINKEEMHHPYKHVIVGKKAVFVDAEKSKISGISKTTKAVFVDFERATYTENPKNVTQFCQYIVSGNISEVLSKKGFSIDKAKIRKLAKEYKDDMSEESFKKILYAF